MTETVKSRPSQLADIIALLLAGGFFALAWQFAQVPTGLNLILAAVLVAGGLRALFEVTINRYHIPTIATGPLARRRIAQLLQEQLPTGPVTIIDLGSGRGELTRVIARTLPRAAVIGIERGRFPHVCAEAMRHFFHLKNLTYQQGDIFAYDCGKVDAVVMFLGQLTGPVSDKLRRELPPGAIVISNEFAFPDSWPAEKVITSTTPFKTALYLYRR